MIVGNPALLLWIAAGAVGLNVARRWAAGIRPDTSH